ncbi:Thioredoxin domain-containing protein 2 [Chytriomyces hyalinus]|uniref:Thioredoxin domain-containing protein n=1 Tax=Chytriomyces confervae TaxID=246404 RepID=A0A507FKZ5_9FUNG|nr:Thioredoxin domain-containing protein 2 [Chytriomyces hyalinus]KAJ3267223.1 Thioredoxin domain-containing protein 2 [Chytriomyces hyalinus]KAJ3404805.1 Thioredoxin domain-containing protein 2 [Chytriomyces hyalinus]TPX77101.1 hypothetical protein CcCBS67573_g01597 [Chytriomyces confervae]
MGGSAVNITSESEFTRYINGSKLTVVDFTATWCGPCKAVAPRFEALAGKFPNCNFIKVDVDDQKAISTAHGVRAMPTFMLFKNGKKLDEVVGADIAKVERLVNTHAAGSSGFPSSGGRTLSGAGPSSATSATRGIPSVAIPNIFSNLTPMQQQYAFIAGMLVLFWYLAK